MTGHTITRAEKMISKYFLKKIKFNTLANKIAIKSSNNPPSKNVSIMNLVY